MSKQACERDRINQDSTYANLTTCQSGGMAFFVSDFPICPLGFYCPHLNVSRNSTWPQICQPSIECQLGRLANQWCESQGRFEPRICAPGYYCPNGSSLLLCPSGSWCPRGSTVPLTCEVLTSCPQGTIIGRHYGIALIISIVDIVLLTIFLLNAFFWVPLKIKRDAWTRRSALLFAGGNGGGNEKTAINGSGSNNNDHASVSSMNPLNAAYNKNIDAAITSSSSTAADDNDTSAAHGNIISSSSTWQDEDDLVSDSWRSGHANANTLSSKLSAALKRFSTSLVTLPAGVELGNDGIVRTTSRRGSFFLSPTKESLSSPNTNAGGSGGSRDRSLSFSKSPVSWGIDLVRARAELSSKAAKSAADSAAAEASGSLDLPAALAARSVLSERFRRANKGLSLLLEFSRLSLHILPPVDKTILAGVSGRIAPGRVTAIMGPSGAGKTTFLSVLMGRKQKGSLAGGTLRINGVEGSLVDFRAITGFVPQNDVMLQELTVRENIAHSAYVRLGRGWARADIAIFIDAVIEVLGLTGCADTLTSKISGGQRKRANIGIELASAPCAIFLDEPTSGLDSTAALQVCGTLRTIADLGLTVVAVIHQPREEIFQSFDDLLLLAPGGKTVYAGPQAEALVYFTQVGLGGGGAKNNFADELLDLIAGTVPLTVSSHDVKATREAALAARVTTNTAETPLKEVSSPSAPLQLRGRDVAAYLCDLWTVETLQREKIAAAEAVMATTEISQAASALKSAATLLRTAEALSARGASKIDQFVLCFLRSLQQQLRRPSWLGLEIVVCIAGGAMMGIASTTVDELFSGILRAPMTPISPAPTISLLPSLAFFISLAIGVSGSPAAVRTFGEERAVFLREHASEHSMRAYFLAKLVAELPRMTLAAAHFAGLFALLARPASSSSNIFIITWGSMYGVYGLATLTSMLVSRSNGALLGTIASLVLACLCGYGPNLNQGRDWGISFIQDISYSRWIAEFMINSEVAAYRSIFVDEIPAGAFGYTLDRPGIDIFMVILLGTLLRGGALVALVYIVAKQPLWSSTTRLNNKNNTLTPITKSIVVDVDIDVGVDVDDVSTVVGETDNGEEEDVDPLTRIRKASSHPASPSLSQSLLRHVQESSPTSSPQISLNPLSLLLSKTEYTTFEPKPDTIVLPPRLVRKLAAAEELFEAARVNDITARIIRGLGKKMSEIDAAVMVQRAFRKARLTRTQRHLANLSTFCRVKSNE